MLTRRIIPCLDIRDGRVVKGVTFQSLRDAGDPVELATRYRNTGADELCFLDVTASVENRPLRLALVHRLSSSLFIPFTVGGGVAGVEDAACLLRHGADKIAVNTAAVQDPRLLTRLAGTFGRQCVVLSIDAKHTEDGWRVTTHGGRRVTPMDCLSWARRGAHLGAGEILLNAVDTDGKRAGFSIDLTQAVADAVSVPVIASGGAGDVEDFVTLFHRTAAAAALAASIFHDGTWTPDSLKRRLNDRGIDVRL